MVTSSDVLAHFSDPDLSEIEVDDLNSLMHHGVKGMKWGVRKDRRGKVKPGSVLKKIGKDPMDVKNKVSRKEAIEKFNEKRAPRGYDFHYGNKRDALRKTMLKAQPKIKKEIKAINKSEKYKNADLRKASKLRDEYYRDISASVTKQLNAASALKGTTRNRQYKLHFDYNVEKDVYPSISIRSNEARGGRSEAKKKARQDRRISHSDEPEESDDIKLIVKWGPKGLIEDISLPGSDVAEHGSILISNMLDGDALEHHGVKGMKWGVRKDRKKTGRAQTSSNRTGSTTKTGALTKASGSVSDLIKKAKEKASVKVQDRQAKKKAAAAEAEKAKAKAKTLTEAVKKQSKNSSNTINKKYSKLSNDELRALNERMRLEKEYDELRSARSKQNRNTSEKLAHWAKDTTVSIASDLAKQEMRRQGQKILRNVVAANVKAPPPKPTATELVKRHGKAATKSLIPNPAAPYKYKGKHRK